MVRMARSTRRILAVAIELPLMLPERSSLLLRRGGRVARKLSGSVCVDEPARIRNRKGIRMDRRIRLSAVALLAVGGLFNRLIPVRYSIGAEGGKEQVDPLQSWNDGKAKQSVLNFVAKVTKEGSVDFVPQSER